MIPLGERELDRLIHQRTRLRILTYLYRNRQASFTTLRDEIDVTAGTLSKHADKLDDAGYLDKRRALTSDGFETKYEITDEGSKAFRRYVNELRGLLGSELEEGDGGGPTG